MVVRLNSFVNQAGFSPSFLLLQEGTNVLQRKRSGQYGDLIFDGQHRENRCVVDQLKEGTR